MPQPRFVFFRYGRVDCDTVTWRAERADHREKSADFRACAAAALIGLFGTA
jgi:hypothetical protein